MLLWPQRVSSIYIVCYFFFNDTATTEIYTLSLHDALPIYPSPTIAAVTPSISRIPGPPLGPSLRMTTTSPGWMRSEEHTSELQSRFDLVCRLLLEKKKQLAQYSTLTFQLNTAATSSLYSTN